MWPYDTKKFTEKPSTKSYEEALKHKSVKYFRVTQCERMLKGCLTAGFPFVFGFTVYESFESEEVAKTGQMIMPTDNDKQL